ncbi:MAG: putative transposase [Gammaproteobacteria bacterium]|jgi:putative transposase
MPRRKRIYLPGFPYHLVQRGNNRQRCFSERVDFENYLDLWREKSHRYGVQVHAYCLMPNHIHFIVSTEQADAISNTMKVVGSRYAFHFNKRYQRSGTVWEGRHRSSLIDSERYLLTCLRYVELNPVRAGMTAFPDTYEWSSYALNAAPRRSWLTPHPVYLALGSDPEERASAYRGLFDILIAEDEIDLIRQAAHYSVPISDDRYRREIELKFSLPTNYSKRGRPTKNSIAVTD